MTPLARTRFARARGLTRKSFRAVRLKSLETRQFLSAASLSTSGLVLEFGSATHAVVPYLAGDGTNTSSAASSIRISPGLGNGNADGGVDLTDLATVLNNFGAPGSNWISGNFGNSTTIDLTDLSDILNNFGNGNISLSPLLEVTDFSFKTLPSTLQNFSSAIFTQHIQGITPTTVSIQTLPANGTLLLNGTTVTAFQTIDVADLGNLSYTSNSGYSGTDSFQWSAAGIFGSASVNITVGDNPPVVQDSTVVSGTRGTIFPSLLLSMFHSASDPDAGDSIDSYSITALPAHGQLIVQGQPVTIGQTLTPQDFVSFQYVPSPGFLGNDSFQWTASDGLLSSTSSATLTLNVEQEPTIGNITKSDSTTAPAHFTPGDFTATFADVNPGTSLQNITITTLPAQGSLTVNGDAVTANQTLSAFDIPSLVYTSGTGGNDTFAFTASDGTLSSSPATVSIHTESPPTLIDQHAVVLPNGHLVVASGTNAAPLNVLSVFTDADGDSPQTAKITRLPTHGKLLLRGAPLHVNQIVAPADIANITYSTTAANIQDSFTLNISDGTAFASSPANITLLDYTSPITLFGQGVVIGNNQPPSTANVTDFGTWTTGANPSLQPDTRSYTLYNTSSKSIRLSALTIGGAASHDFILLNSAAGTILAPGQSVALTIRFAPKAAGLRKATLTIPIGAGTKPVVIQLAGTGAVSKTVHTDAAGAGGIVQVATTQGGTGAGAVNGQILSISYVGYLADGTVFDSSAAHSDTAKTGLSFRLDDAYARNQPFINNDAAKPLNTSDFPVIAGWEFGLQGIKLGEKRTLIMNATAAYGPEGNGAIPANATLRFDVQCVAIQSKPQISVFGVVNGNTAIPITAGQSTISANAGTLVSLTSNQTSVSQEFGYFVSSKDNADGTPLPNLAVFSIALTGPNAADFTVDTSPMSGSLQVFTVTFHPTGASKSARNATVHIHSNDAAHPDFTFAVRGTIVAASSTMALVTVR